MVVCQAVLECIFDPQRASERHLYRVVVRPNNAEPQFSKITKDGSPFVSTDIDGPGVIVVGDTPLENALKQAERVFVDKPSTGNPVRSGVATRTQFKVLSTDALVSDPRGA